MDQVIHPDQLRNEARLAYQQGDFQAAEKLFKAAMDGYASAGDPLSAAEVANDRCVVLLLSGDAAQALDVVNGTDQVFAAAGDWRRQAIALGNRGDVLESLGKPREAMTCYEQAAELFKQAGDYELRSYVMKSISKLQFRQGRVWEALGTMYAGIDGIPNPSFSQRLLKRLLRWPLKQLTGMRQ